MTSCPPFVIHATNTKPAARTDTKWLRMIRQLIHAIKENEAVRIANQTKRHSLTSSMQFTSQITIMCLRTRPRPFKLVRKQERIRQRGQNTNELHLLFQSRRLTYECFHPPSLRHQQVRRMTTDPRTNPYALQQGAPYPVENLATAQRDHSAEADNTPPSNPDQH